MRKLAAALGMQQEGIRPQHLFLDGQWVDVVDFGVLRQPLHFSV
jgi:RimJ/RimL family protein N-acetyltransferase